MATGPDDVRFRRKTGTSADDQNDAIDPSQTLAAGRANRDVDRRATLGGLFSALTGTNGSTNFRQQRDDNQGERRQCCPIKALSTIPKNSRFSDRS